MRILFFLLLFTSLVLLLWQTQIARSGSGVELPAVSAERRLVLLKEHQAAQLTQAAPQTHALEIPDVELVDEELKPATPAATPAVPEQPVLSCYTIGPFADIERAKVVTERIKTLGAKVARRSKTEQEQFGYRVFLPPYKTREAAVAATKVLDKNGITDYFVISDEEQKNGISLGLFRKKTGAERRMAQVKRFDFKPQMEIRYRDNTIYWLDYEQTGERVTESVWREIAEETPNLQQLPRDCSAKTA